MKVIYSVNGNGRYSPVENIAVKRIFADVTEKGPLSIDFKALTKSGILVMC